MNMIIWIFFLFEFAALTLKIQLSHLSFIQISENLKILVIHLILFAIAHIIFKILIKLIWTCPRTEVYHWKTSILKWGCNLNRWHERFPLNALRNKILKIWDHWKIIEIVCIIIIFLDWRWIIVKVLNVILKIVRDFFDWVLVIRVDLFLIFSASLVFIF